MNTNLVKEFIALVGKEQVLAKEVDRQAYAYDAAVLTPQTPALVVIPTTQEQLGKVVKLAYANGLPITVRGAGSNLSGAVIPSSADAVVILTNQLNRIIEINEEDLYAVVEPGVITSVFAEAASSHGL
ncbi:MAG: FAD-binding oxidoreductase, partial [Bacteroidales bacterium]|nr:FAD-binding oxidoreductase [Bacteroidales bacterium]